MERIIETEAYPIRIKPYALIIILLWSAFITASLLWNIYQTRQGILEIARIQARNSFMKDVIYRRWNAGHGGVYVPVSNDARPNPYLNVPARDIISSSGTHLTLINPAYMTRQVHEITSKRFGIQGHITSLNPIRPANAADTWETHALKAFEDSVKEVSSLEDMKSEEYMRFMRPLMTEKGCLKCHAAQGYKAGDIRGGISVSVPMSPLWAVERSNIVNFSLGHGLLWLIGLIGIGFGARRLDKQIIERNQAQQKLIQSETLFKGVMENTKNGVAIFKAVNNGEDFVFLDLNKAGERIDKIKREDIIEKKVSEIFPGVKEFGLFEVFQCVWKTGKPENHPVGIYKDERITGWRENYVFKLPSGEIVAVYSDETERKQAEETIMESHERLETILHSIPVGVIIIDPETHKIIDANPKAVLMRGGPIEAGTVCHKYICPTEIGKCPITDLGKSVDEAERVLITSNNKNVPVLKSVIPVTIDGKEYLIECFTDLRDQKQAEKDRVQREKLQSAIEMAGTICHEMNQPLMALSGNAELLLMDLNEDHQHFSKIKRIKKQVDRMGSITKKLMHVTSYKTKDYLNGKIIDLDAASSKDETLNMYSKQTLL